MKLYMKVNYYANAKVTLHGPGEKEVDDTLGKYLVTNFPDWFVEIKEEKEEKVVASDIPNAETKENGLKERSKRKRKKAS